MNSTKSTARRAGVLYLLTALMAPFYLIYVPSVFIVPGNATATANNIAAGELMYRLGILTGLVSNIIFLVMVLTLYKLLKDVDRTHARVMVVLVVVGVTIGLVNLFNQMAPLILLSGADYLSVFTKPQLDALALSFLGLRSSGTSVAMAFWALWLFPFGVLVIKSGFFPKLLGVLLIIGGFAYLVVSFTSILLPAYGPVVSRVTLPFYAVGELSMIIWLVVKGAKAPTPDALPS
jgi:uncharacterized protein DUF4386